MDDMLETMYQAIGIGLAAPQVGQSSRVIVLDVAREGEKPQPLQARQPRDPVALARADDRSTRGACRCRSIMPTSPARPRSGCAISTTRTRSARCEAKGLLATCLQHEIDHLDGVLFVDHLSLAEARDDPAQARQGEAQPSSRDRLAPGLGGERAMTATAPRKRSTSSSWARRPLPRRSSTALIEAGHRILAVYTQPPRPAGRGHRPQPSPVQVLAAQHGLAVRSPVSLRTPEAQAAFAELGADAAVVAAYGLILPPPILAAPRLGCLNVHASLLPRWRGAAPIQRALLAGDTRDRDHDHADGGRARHRPDPAAGGGADRAAMRRPPAFRPSWRCSAAG